MQGRALELAMFGERVHAPASHHEVVENADIDERERLRQRAREPQVSLARFRVARRMVVRQHYAGGIARQCFLEHFTRVHARVSQCKITAKQLHLLSLWPALSPTQDSPPPSKPEGTATADKLRWLSSGAVSTA